MLKRGGTSIPPEIQEACQVLSPSDSLIFLYFKTQKEVVGQFEGGLVLLLFEEPFREEGGELSPLAKRDLRETRGSRCGGNCRRGQHLGILNDWEGNKDLRDIRVRD
jgi:hypothetical protein